MKQMNKTLTAVCLLFLFTVGSLAGQDSDRITFEEVNEQFGLQSTRTDLWKKETWRSKYKGKCVIWGGQLTGVMEIFGIIAATFKHLPTTFVHDVSLHVPVSEKEKFMNLTVGAMYAYLGTLDDYGVILPIQVKWGCGSETLIKKVEIPVKD